MPVANARGDILGGVAGVSGSLKPYGASSATPFPFQSFGGGSWLRDPSPEFPNGLVLVSIPAPPPLEAILATWEPGTATPVPLPVNRGANSFAAGGDVWAAWLSGFGFFWSLPEPTDAAQLQAFRLRGDAGRLAVARDGTVAYIPDRGYGYGLNLHNPDGTETVGPGGAVAYSEQTIQAGAAIWMGNNAIGTPPPRPAAADAQGTQLAILADGRRFLAYWSDVVGFVVQPDGALEGWILGRTPTFFNHHVVALESGLLFVCWSTTQGEGPADLFGLAIDPASAMSPIEPEPKPPATIPTFTFTHPVLVAPFKDPNGDTDAPYEIVVNQTGQVLDRPCFVAEDSLDWRGSLEGIYSEAVDPSAVLEVARSYATRLVLAHDSIDDWTPPAGLRPYDVPVLELYLSEGETLEQSADRWRRQLQNLLEHWQGTAIGVIPMFYCMGGAPPDELFSVDQVLAGLSYLSEIVNYSTRVVVVAPFAYLRANGITGHGELQDAFANLLAEQRRVGLASLPAVVDPEPPDPEPPDPEPEPEPPQPEPEPEEPEMVFIETKFPDEKKRVDVNPKLAVMKFEVVKNADGTESYKSVARAADPDTTISGTPIYCVTDQGADEWRASPGGTFESFRRVGTTLVADRDWDGKYNAYVRFCVEVS